MLNNCRKFENPNTRVPLWEQKLVVELKTTVCLGTTLTHRFSTKLLGQFACRNSLSPGYAPRTKIEFSSPEDVNNSLFQILNESFLPLIGEKKTRYECETDIFEVRGRVFFLVLGSKLYFGLFFVEFFVQRTITNLTIFQDSLVCTLFKFVQGAAHLWDTHEIGMARQERALQVPQLRCVGCS